MWLAYTPGQPNDPHQPRPVLVVSADARNRARAHVMVVPIFSRGNLGPTRLVIPAQGTGLQYDSVLFCEELTTLPVALQGAEPVLVLSRLLRSERGWDTQQRALIRANVDVLGGETVSGVGRLHPDLPGL